MVEADCEDVEPQLGPVGLLMEGYVFDMKP